MLVFEKLMLAHADAGTLSGQVKNKLAIKNATVTARSISLGIISSFSYLNKQNAGK